MTQLYRFFDMTSEHPTPSERWSLRARRLGIASAIGIFGIGVCYVAVIALWMIIEATPREPIGDPYLAVMEVLTILSALALLGLVIALWFFADAPRRVPALAALVTGSLAAGLTMTVHFVQLTAVRQLWRAGHLPDYRLVWPSTLFAVEYFAWDVLVGIMMVSIGLTLKNEPTATPARRAFLIGGALCLLGTIGPLSGRMLLQNISVLGYAIMLPIAGGLMARVFRIIHG